jgi:transcriptional antiterminator RfaH
MSDAARWYVVHTQPNGEGRAVANLLRQGFSAYLPRYRRNRSHARRIESVVRPLFPRYLFVKLDTAHDRWRAINSTFGVSHLVTVGDEPIAVPEGTIDEIRSREDNSGCVVLGLPQGLVPGGRVQITEGLLAEHEGVIDRVAGERRVAILLDLLGRQVRVFVPAAAVTAA